MGAEKVYLRPITAEDTTKVVAWRNKDFVRKNFIYQKPFTEEGHMTWFREQVETGHVAQFIICVAASEGCREKNGGAENYGSEDVQSSTEKVCKTDAEGFYREVGSVYLRDIDREAGTAEYGVFIGEEDALGRGYGTKAAKLMLAYGFEKLGLNKIFLRFLEDNTGAKKSYEKAGFQMIEGRRETVNWVQGKKAVFFMETERGMWESTRCLRMENV